MAVRELIVLCALVFVATAELQCLTALPLYHADSYTSSLGGWTDTGIFRLFTNNTMTRVLTISSATKGDTVSFFFPNSSQVVLITQGASLTSTPSIDNEFFGQVYNVATGAAGANIKLGYNNQNALFFCDPMVTDGNGNYWFSLGDVIPFFSHSEQQAQTIVHLAQFNGATAACGDFCMRNTMEPNALETMLVGGGNGAVVFQHFAVISNTGIVYALTLDAAGNKVLTNSTITGLLGQFNQIAAAVTDASTGATSVLASWYDDNTGLSDSLLLFSVDTVYAPSTANLVGSKYSVPANCSLSYSTCDGSYWYLIFTEDPIHSYVHSIAFYVFVVPVDGSASQTYGPYYDAATEYVPSTIASGVTCWWS